MNIHRAGVVYYLTTLAGRVEQRDDGYVFTYDPTYLKQAHARAISLTMPLSVSSYHSKTLHPFFDGLIPEGWLLEIAAKNWKLNPRDRMGLLLALCRDCIGAVHVEEVHVEEDLVLTQNSEVEDG